MKNINNKFQEEYEHRGFSDIMVYSKDYPKDCFDPREYFDPLTGYFKFHYGPVLPVPPIRRLIEIDNRERQKEYNKNKVKVLSIKDLAKEKKVMDLTQCPICRRLIQDDNFEEHYKKCAKEEKEELKKEKEQKENEKEKNT